MRPNFRGFTLIEALLGLSILMLMMGALFQILNLTFSQFQLGSNRIGLQAELHRSLSALERDVNQSSIYSMNQVTRTATVPVDPAVPAGNSTVVRRDGLCFASVDNTGNSGNFATASTGQPLWNCFTIYYANLSSPNGKFLRLQVQSPSPGHSTQSPLVSFVTTPSNYLDNAAPSNLIGDIHVLSTNIYSFEVAPDIGNQTVSMNISFRADDGRLVVGQKSLAEVVSTKILLYPNNTVPKM